MITSEFPDRAGSSGATPSSLYIPGAVHWKSSIIMPGRRTAWSLIPIPWSSRALGCWAVRGWVYHWFRRAGDWPLPPPWSLARQTFPINPWSFRSDQRITWTMSQAPWPWFHLRPLEQFLLPCCLKSSFRTGFFSMSFGKRQVMLIQLRRSSSFFCGCVVFPLSCKLLKGISRTFPDLWKAVRFRGLLMAWQTAGTTASL